MMIDKLKKDLEIHKQIIIIEGFGQEYSTKIRNFLDATVQQRKKNNVMVYGTCDVGKREDEFGYNVLENNEYNEIMRLYKMYEFSDCLRVISCSNNLPYASLLNYLQSGLLSEEELLEALLS